MMLVLMQTLAASPDMILEQGKVYNLPPALAKRYIEAKAATAVLPGTPAAKKVTRIPSQPDPEDTPDVDMGDENLEEDDDE